MTREAFTNSLVGMTNLASASGLSDVEQCHALLLTALCIADRHVPGGASRELFVRMAVKTYDQLRQALWNGPSA